MEREKLLSYANLIARVGANIKKGQEVIISAELDAPEFVTMLTEECYKAGAKRVTVEWTHSPISKLSAVYCSKETLSEVASWQEEKLKYQVENLPVKIYLLSEDPDAMAGIDQTKYSAALATRYKIIKPYRDAMDNKYQWCIAAVAGKDWAKKVFPDLSETDAVEKMWEVILKASRADGDDPVQAWAQHNANLSARCQYLNNLGLKYLEYKSANGTDLTVELLEDGIFAGGLGVDCAYQGILVSILTVIAFYIGEFLETGHLVLSNIPDSSEGMTMAFFTMAMCEIFHSFNMRSQRGSAVAMLFKGHHNVALYGAMIGSFLLTTAVVEIDFLSNLFGFAHLDLKAYAISLGLAFLIIPIVEVVKFFQRKFGKAHD